jgi:hypothetical protein
LELGISKSQKAGIVNRECYALIGEELHFFFELPDFTGIFFYSSIKFWYLFLGGDILWPIYDQLDSLKDQLCTYLRLQKNQRKTIRIQDISGIPANSRAFFFMGCGGLLRAPGTKI